MLRRQPEISRFTVSDYIQARLNNLWGLQQPLYLNAVTYANNKPSERVENSFEGYVYGGYKVNPIVYGCMQRRSSVFSEARPMWRHVVDGKPGDRLRRLRPDWVNIILSGNPLQDPEVDVMGYWYSPGGPDNGDGVPYLPD